MRRTGSLLGVLLASLSMVAAPTLAVAEPPPAPAPTIDWKPCEGKPKVECATIPVPVDWSRPDGKTIDMAVARRKASNPDQRIGSLVYMPGGPGGSGVSGVLAGLPFSPEITKKFDIVSFDPRGIARSSPVKCDTKIVANAPEIVPDGSEKQYQRVLDRNRKLAESCREGSGALLDHMDNVSTAHDIDALRKGLGEDRISLYGVSYGTLTGQMYAENFPRHVRALVLDSVMDHSLGATGFFGTEAATAEDSFNEFVKWCERTKSCALHGEDVVKVFDSLYERAERGELHVPGDPKTPVHPEDLTNQAIGAAYGPSWPQFAKLLRQLHEQRDVTVSAQPARTPYPNAAFCADWRIDVRSADQYRQEWEAQRKLAPHVRFGLGWPIGQSCVGWPAKIGNPQHRPEIEGTPPILILNSQHDPATAYAWATNVDRQVEAATLLTYDGWGHGVYDRSGCTQNASDRYFVDLTTPEPGTHCPAVPPEQSSASTMADLASPPGQLGWTAR